jgi:hypothetical protein
VPFALDATKSSSVLILANANAARLDAQWQPAGV